MGGFTLSDLLDKPWSQVSTLFSPLVRARCVMCVCSSPEIVLATFYPSTSSTTTNCCSVRADSSILLLGVLNNKRDTTSSYSCASVGTNYASEIYYTTRVATYYIMQLKHRVISCRYVCVPRSVYRSLCTVILFCGV